MGCELVTGLEYTYVVLVDRDMSVKELVPVGAKPKLATRVANFITPSLTMWHISNFKQSLYLTLRT